MKELTELPEKWCINRFGKPDVIKYTKNNCINKETTNDFSYKLLGWYTHFPSWGANSHTSDTIKPGYTEITYDQFKKWVLKEPQFEVGKWYKIELESKFNHIFQFDKYCNDNKEISLKH